MWVCNVTNIRNPYQVVYVASVKQYNIINIFVPNCLPKTVNFITFGYWTSYVNFLDQTPLFKNYERISISLVKGIHSYVSELHVDIFQGTTLYRFIRTFGKTI
jgi:hypothetical protein